MTEERVLWINTGGTLVSRAYRNPYNPPRTVKPLLPSKSYKLFYNLLRSIDGGADRYVDGYSYGITDTPNKTLGRFQKDSKDFTEADIEALARIIRDTDHTRILITHGTDALAENASRLKAALQEMGVSHKKIVMTGAMLPLSMVTKFPEIEVDAKVNIETALHELNEGELEPGVYVAGRNDLNMRMTCMDPNTAIKNMKASKRAIELTLSAR